MLRALVAIPKPQLLLIGVFGILAISFTVLPAVIQAQVEIEKREESEGKSGVRLLRSDNVRLTQDDKAMKASLIEVNVPPLGAGSPHRHPGFVMGYILEGTLEFKIEGQPQRTLRKGDSFFEPTMILHELARNPDSDSPCRFLVTMVHPADAKRLVIPEPDPNAPNPAP